MRGRGAIFSDPAEAFDRVVTQRRRRQRLDRDDLCDALLARVDAADAAALDAWEARILTASSIEEVLG